MKYEETCATIGIVAGLASKFLGGFDYILKAMAMLMLIDIVSGFICAAVFNTSKFSKNGVTSEALFKGAIRKISMLFIVAVAVIIDRIMEFDYVRNSVVMYFIATEGISVLEHIVTMGVPVPKFITLMLENIRQDSEKKVSLEKPEDTEQEYKPKRLKDD